MDCQHHRAYPDKDLPLDCWHNILGYLEPPDIVRAGAVNRTCRSASYDGRLWCPYFKAVWSPEYCGSLQTKQDSKDFCSLYRRWRSGQPAAVEIIPVVHGHEAPVAERQHSNHCDVNAVQLTQAGALAAWSVGRDGVLVGTDITTCRVRNRFEHPQEALSFWACTVFEATESLPRGSGDGLYGLTVLDSVGLVCTAGKYMTGWDPRATGNGPSPTPAFSTNLEDADVDLILTMISARSPEPNGPPQILTGGEGDTVCLWDLRFVDGGPVRRYVANAHGIYSLAVEPRHGTLLGGGRSGVTCWDWETGAVLTFLHADGSVAVNSLAVGRDRLVSGSAASIATAWAIPDPQAITEETEPEWGYPLYDKDNHCISGKAMQGLGEGPDRLLAGTLGGSVCMWECGENLGQLPICWSLEDHNPPHGPVSCLAATDQVVVNGFDDGALRIMRIDPHLLQHRN